MGVRPAPCPAFRIPLHTAAPAVADNQPVSKQNRMNAGTLFSGLASRLKPRIAELGSRPGPFMPEAEFNTFALGLFDLQFQHVAPYRRFCEGRGVVSGSVNDWRDVPAIPTSAFKELELTSLAPEECTSVFHSSGTTADKPSRHFHSAESLALYETSLLGWFRQHVVGDWDRLIEDELAGPLDKPAFIFLTPPSQAVPHSSLVHMFETTRRELASRDSVFTGRVGTDGAWQLDLDATLFAIRKSMCANRPVTLLGTAFSFVHLLDHFAANNMRYRLAEGSRVLETGGYKGRSREMPKGDLHALITKHLGIPADRIVCEYGMSELGSQAYVRTACSDEPKDASPALHFPPWTRLRLIDPETATEARAGQPGIIRIFDLANVYSVAAIQTGDLGIARGDGFELVGRAAMAEARGCSLMPA